LAFLNNEIKHGAGSIVAALFWLGKMLSPGVGAVLDLVGLGVA
jgi:hypothetical protein